LAPAAPPWHLLSLADLAADAWRDLLHRAETLAGPKGREPLLRGRRLGMIFFQPSLRTRTAFEVACFDLGAHAVHHQVGGGLWGLEHRDGVPMDADKAEHVKEGIGVLSRMLDALGVRCFAGLADAAEDRAEPVLTAVARASRVPVLSLESAMDHPHQGIADALTVRRRLRGQRAKVVVLWAPHVKPLPMAVPHAATLAFAHEGHDVVVCRPEGYDLDASTMAKAVAIAGAAGGSLAVTADRDAALRGARVVYAKEWGSARHYGDPEAAKADLATKRGWIVDGRTMALADRAAFLHCLPVRRGVAVADEVLDGPWSAVLDQGAARLEAQKATLTRAFGVEVAR
jgi:N-acetylornithine carbamoyltransferase